jgi:hypothetical protein
MRAGMLLARTQRLEVFASVLVQSLPTPPRRRAYFSAIASRSLATRLPTMSRNLPKGAPLPKAPFAAGVAIMGGMFYAVLLDAKGRQPDIPAAEQGSANTLSADADTSSSSTANAKTQPKSGAQFLGGYEEVSMRTHRRGTQHVHRAVHCMCTACCLLHVHGIHPARYRRPTYHRMCSLRPTWTTSKSCRCAEARRVCTPAHLLPIHPLHCRSTGRPPAPCICTHCRSTAGHLRGMCTACARHVHRMCTACARHVHGMCTACARHVICLQVALARRQCWVRAFQLGPILGLLSYSTCVLVEAAGVVKLPRGSRTGVRTAAWP